LFRIPGTGVQTIQPLSALPTLADSVTVDGSSQPGYAGTPLIEVSGASAGSAASGFTLTGLSIVRGLVVNRFSDAGVLMIGAAGNNHVEVSYIGTDASGLAARPNGSGIRATGTLSNQILASVVSGNNGPGIDLIGPDLTHFTLISGNKIGL